MFKLIQHPLIRHKIGLLRQKDITTKKFRELSNELSTLLAYEALKDLELEEKTIQTWSGETNIQSLKGKKLVLAPILRAGLGMLDGVLNIVPNAKINVIGMYRDEQTLTPVIYYKKFSKQIKERMVLILDPMLATGGSVLAAIDLFKQQGVKQIKIISLVAAPEGVRKIEDKYPEIDIFCASLDSHLNNQGYIIPGLGDAGDKIFGTK